METMRSSVEREKSLSMSRDDPRRRRNPSSSPFNNASEDGFLMRPKPGDKFNKAIVEKVIESTLSEFFLGKKYKGDLASTWADELSALLLRQVKDLNFQRYKLIASATIGEQLGSGLNVSMRSLWDADTDVYATFNYSTDSLFCIATIYGIYYY